jgi:hypothetical protein
MVAIDNGFKPINDDQNIFDREWTQMDVNIIFTFSEFALIRGRNLQNIFGHEWTRIFTNQSKQFL